MQSIQDTALIARAQLFGNPERGACHISPDGQWLAFGAPADGVMNIWLCRRGELAAARPITHDRSRGIMQWSWAYDNEHLLFMQDEGGDENFHLHAVSVRTGAVRDLTPFAGVRGLLQAQSRKHPDEVLITLNRRNPQFADIFRLTIATGAMTLVQENQGMAGFVTDSDFKVRLAKAPQADGSWLWLKPNAGDTAQSSTWTTWQQVAAGDAMTTFTLHIAADGKTLYILDSRGRDTAALLAFDLDTDAPTGTLIAQDPRADISDLIEDLDSLAPIAYAATVERRSVHVLDERFRADLNLLDGCALGEWDVVSRTTDDQLWTIRFSRDTNPASYYLYDRRSHDLSKLYDCYPQLVDAPLARMQHTTIKSRDGLDLVCYLTLPVYADHPDVRMSSRVPVPLVLLVHGGPWMRDDYGYNAMHQWLANRGYAVLAVNFRASIGFGKAFINAGDLEWGGKMDDDLCDAVDWAITRGIADPERVAIMGGSYGGYATLWALTAHPERYACGVDIVGPSNLETLLASTPPQWEALLATLYRQLGHPDTPEGRALLRERSPLHRAANIRKPLLIGQGANDQRVKQAEADQMARALKANAIPVTYVLYPDEGHGFQRPSNRISFNAITEQFLAQYLRGRCEPTTPAEVAGNTAIMVENALTPVA